MMNTKPSLYELSWVVDEEEYRKNEALSYSTLAKFNRGGFDSIPTLFDSIQTPSLIFGSMVDCLLTGTNDEFNSKFEVATFPNISDTLRDIVTELFNNYNEEYSSIEVFPDELLATIGYNHNYYANSKYEALRVKKIKQECSTYYKLLFIAKDKTLVSTEEFYKALECVNILRNSENTKNFFSVEPFNNSIDKFYQLKFKGSYKGIPVRVMLDLVVVDHVNKLIIPVDLKTTSKKEYEFHKSFIEWNYYIQAQLYTYVLKQNLQNHPEFKDYQVCDFKFVVINKNSLLPQVWSYEDSNLMEDVYYGKKEQYYCRFWGDILEELNSYLHNKSLVPNYIKPINKLTEILNLN